MMNKRISFSVLSLFAAFIIFVLPACNQDSKWEKEEEEKIQSYLNSHPELAYQATGTGLYYLDVVVGTGVQPVTYDTVFIYLYGYYLDGERFYTNFGTTDTIVFSINDGSFFIKGINEAVSNMKTGGESKIVVPSYLAYGNSGYFMPAYTPLLFDIYLVRVKPGPGARKK